jgi:hypothetical protein
VRGEVRGLWLSLAIMVSPLVSSLSLWSVSIVPTLPRVTAADCAEVAPS